MQLIGTKGERVVGNRMVVMHHIHSLIFSMLMSHLHIARKHVSILHYSPSVVSFLSKLNSAILNRSISPLVNVPFDSNNSTV